MAVTLNVNGTTYSFPQTGDEGWGDQVTQWAQAVTSGMLQKAGGTFTLTAEVDFGASFGLRSLYYRSRGANAAGTGVVRLANAETIAWRNQANSADLALTVNSSDELAYGGTKLALSGSIVDADISAIAAIAYSKLNLSGSIVNADVSNSAAIAYSKLSLAGSIVDADIANSAAIAYSKLALAGSVVDADISASAAIARSKIAAGTASHVVIHDGSGNLSSEATLAKSRGGAGADMSSVTFPSSGTLVTRDATETLTNKTLTSPVISSISNTGTLTLPTATDTLVGRATTDTLTNKTISGASNTITNVSLSTGVTGTLPIANGGTGQTTQVAAFDALAPTTSKGDLIVHDGTDNVRLTAGANDTVLIADSATPTGLKWGAVPAVPTGVVMPYAGSSAPSGYLLCAGQEVSRTTYASLDSVIGTTYGAYTNGSGGAGTTHFRLPDLRGRVAVGRDDMNGSAANRVTTAGSGVDGITLGANGGSQTHTLTEAQLPSHTHTQVAHSHIFYMRDNSTAGTGFRAMSSSGTGDAVNRAVNTSIENQTASNNSTGSGSAHQNMQPSIILNYIIKF